MASATFAATAMAPNGLPLSSVSAASSIEFSDQAKSDIYKELLPLLNSGKIALLDHPRLIAQLCGLERRTARSGKDSIDHAPGAHDDIATTVAGALVRVEASRRLPSYSCRRCR